MLSMQIYRFLSLHRISVGFKFFVAMSVFSLFSSYALANKSLPNQSDSVQRQLPVTTPQGSPQLINQGRQQPKIQLAILLDTSSSMDGLIDQTRNQLWQVVNEFSSAKQNGITPVLEVALFEYGNSGIAKSEGHIRQLNRFTRELDKVSEGLFQLTTNGGDEYCGMAIKTAINNLQWSSVDSDLKTIFIAGNEPFTQGPVAYQEAIALAKRKGITVNTIFAGQHQQGIETGWHNGAMLAGGDYMSIDANQAIAHIEAPQDPLIAKLNQSLNQTYLPYGEQGQEKAQRQAVQDEQSNQISGALLASRAKSKVSSFYNNSQWDLVDAMNDGEIGEAELQEMDAKALPESMQKMDAGKRKDFILKQAAERQKIKQEIAELSQQRDQFVAEKRKNQATSAPSVSDALTQAVVKQAEQKAFKFAAEKVVKPTSEKQE